MCLSGGSSALVFLALILCQGPGHAYAKNDNYQMSDVCKQYFLRDLYRKIDGAVLISENERDLDCAITFQTHSILQRFMLRFDQLQLDCNDHLYIYDGAHAVGSYKYKSKTFSSRNSVSLRPLIMTVHCACYSLFEKCFYLTFLLVLVAAEKTCDETKCPGPLKYYKDLGCKPVYENPGDCCAVEYYCDHLKSRSQNKCYVNGHEYNVGEELREEDRNPCEFECKCLSGNNGVASFVCAGTDCALLAGEPNCYYRFKPDQCCPGPLVCLKENEERPTCEVDGKIYKDGEHFKPKSDPELNCYCGPDYKGENVAPFCLKPNRPPCAVDFRNANAIYSNCAPVYYNEDSPQTDCNVGVRCQNPNDVVIHNHDDLSSEDLEEKTCKFGNLTMHLGDELNESDNFSKCLKCVCEVPPVPTCQRLPRDKCDNSCTFFSLC